MTDEQKKVLEAAGITDATDVSRYGSGHINETYKVETASGVRYILQRVNTTIFDVDLLKTNVVRVTEFLKSKGVRPRVREVPERPRRHSAAASRGHHPEVPRHAEPPEAARRCRREGREGPA